jgi:hypothetical protein
MGEMQGGSGLGRGVEFDFDGKLMELSVWAQVVARPSKLRVNQCRALTEPFWLFVAEGDQGIHANGAAGWDVAGGKGNDEK